jgi:transposase
VQALVLQLGKDSSTSSKPPSFDGERAARPVKVQQRTSGGCWRTLQGLADLAVVQSYLSTAANWGLSRYDALRHLFTSGPWIPPGLTPTTA